MTFQSDFSNGLLGWHGLAYGSGIAAGAGFKGGDCLRLVQPSDTPEANVTSDPFGVHPGRRYRVSARVRLIRPRRAGYKVTIDWLDAAGQHIAYSNDWTGTAIGNDWDLHTARIIAPDTARRALIILGVTPGAELLFDDIRVEAVSAAIDILSLGADHPMPQTGQRVMLRASVRDQSLEPLKQLHAVFRVGAESLPAQAHPQPDKSVNLIAEWRPKQAGVSRIQLEVTADGLPRASASSRLRVCGRSRREVSTDAGAVRLTAVSDAQGGAGLRLSVSGVTRALLPGPVWLQVAAQEELAPAGMVWRRVQSALVGAIRHECFTGQLRVQPSGDGWFDAVLTLTARRPMPLYGLLFPRVHTTGPHRSALLPGLEYLTAAERSSGLDACSPDCAERFLPHPNKMTLPLAAIERGGWTVGITYTPTASGRQAPAPSPVFATPDRLTESTGGLMALIWPAVGDQRVVNDLRSAQPISMRAGERLVLTCRLFAIPTPDDVSQIMPVVLRRLPFPEPDAIGSLQDRWTQSVADTGWAWDDDRIGWRREAHHAHWIPDPAIAAALVNHARQRRGAHAATHRTRAMNALAHVTEGWTKPGAAGMAALLQLGRAEDAIAALYADPGAWLQSQQPDGSWRFKPRGAQEAGLGTEGATDLGICAEPARNLLDIALNTGRRDAQEAGLKAIAYMRTHFRRPAGGETWEVPLHAPNLRAAALACDCGVFAWQLTGKSEYLEFARYWAVTGLPFLYNWEAPRRPGMHYATVSVFGATFFTMPWFGKPVQWVGLVYADALRRLAHHDTSLPWQRFANGILHSAIIQCDLARHPDAGCPWPGALPDSYDVVKNVVNAAWIGPWQIIDQLADALGTPVLSRRVHRTSSGWMTLVSAAPIDRWDVTRNGCRIALTCTPSDTIGLVLRGTPTPLRLHWNGELWAPADRGLGWYWDERADVVAVNLRFAAAKGVLEIVWE